VLRSAHGMVRGVHGQPLLITERRCGMMHKQAIEQLKDGESYEWTRGDCVEAEIWRKHRMYFLFEGKLCGEVPIFVDAYIEGNVGILIKAVESWT